MLLESQTLMAIRRTHNNVQPDLHPLYPNPSDISILLSSESALGTIQKSDLVSHCLTRACVFGDLSLLSYLLLQPASETFLVLTIRDEDGRCLVSLTIQGFSAEFERDTEREECVRLLVARGASVNDVDNAGWTPLHYAALLSPPTLVSYLLARGCSPLSLTNRHLTAWDIVAAYSTLPGRENICLLLEEAMRCEGWEGGRIARNRKHLNNSIKRYEEAKIRCYKVSEILHLHSEWWGIQFSGHTRDGFHYVAEGPELDEILYTPPIDYTTMLVFSPADLPRILRVIIEDFIPCSRNADPANTLYMMARFACLNCDRTWLEDLIIGATDAIEEKFFSRSEDIACLVFWLYNTAVWLHLMQCDNSINEICETSGSFLLIEELINSVFVFIIRFAERRIDHVLDSALLDHCSFSSGVDLANVESDWAFLRPFNGKKKSGKPNPSVPPAPAHTHINLSTPLSSQRDGFSFTKPQPSKPFRAIFLEPSPPTLSSPDDLTSFLTALDTLLISAGINPAFIIQLWSQVMYWTSCEIFNRVITRKKFLCRSQAYQISQNLDVLQKWLDQMGLPRGILSHFSAVRDLLNWVQLLSSITDFPSLVATIQAMKSINPLQMRRAVRDYKYDVHEAKMTEECVQYLSQLQKDWERHRIKLGVEAFRQEVNDRRHESVVDNVSLNVLHTSVKSELAAAQRCIDLLFEQSHGYNTWEPIKPPEALGELLDSRYMLPLLFPSDPRLLSAASVSTNIVDSPRPQHLSRLDRPSYDTTRLWQSRSKEIRELGIDEVRRVDSATYRPR